MEAIAQDVKYALRGLVRRPAFAALVTMTLGLGIGASTAIFTVFDAALLRPLPYPDAERLVVLGETGPSQPEPRQASHPDYRDWSQARSFERVGGYAYASALLTGAGAAERARATRVSAGFFPTLGIRPLLGRTFTDQEEDEGGAVVLSHGLWQRRFGGDPGAVGRTLEVNGKPHAIVGVLPAGFVFAKTGARDLWLPLAPSTNERERRYMHAMWVIGRLRPEATLADARAEMSAVAAHTAEIDPQWHAGQGIGVASLHQDTVAAVRPLLNVLMAGVGLVLLIACVNVAGVLLARGAEREREVALRTALGASARHVVGQALTESLVLALLGGVLGALWGQWGVRGLVAAIPESVRFYMPYLEGLRLDGRVLAFAGVATLLTGLLAGVAPAARAARMRIVHERLRAGAHTIAAGRQRTQDMLVTAEIALALMLLLGAGLLTRSFVRLMHVDPGFDTRNLLTFEISMPPALAAPGTSLPLQRELLARLAALPGVRGAAAVDQPPLQGRGNSGSPTIVGRPPATARDEIDVQLREVSAGYFGVMGVPVLEGRAFADADVERRAPVVLVNRAFRDRVFPGGRAVGERVGFAFTGDTKYEIVGVVANERVTTLDAEPPPTLYWPTSGGGTAFVVRTAVAPESLRGAVEDVVRGVSRDLAVAQVASMDEVVAASPQTFLRRYPALLLASFGLAALVLALVGIYGVLSQHTARRTREIGVRMALGARPFDVLRLVLGRVAVLTLAGITLGTVASLYAGQALSALLFQVRPGDPWATAVGALLMFSQALVAGYGPARRAMSVDPTTALRSE